MESSKNINRRNFLEKTAVLGSAMAAGATTVQAQTAKRKYTTDYFRVGCLNVNSYSHLMGIWGPVINPRDGEKDTPMTGMRITHCWEIDPVKAEEFAKLYNCEVVKNFDDMVGKVDGIISGGYYNHPWNHIIHEPYLEAGLPNLINRPFSNSLAKAKKMLETAKKYNAKILCPSSHEHNNPISMAKAWAADKKIVCYTATNSFDDYPTHGTHGVYLICKAIAEAGNPVVSVAYRANSWYHPPGVLTYEHADKDGRQFFGTLHQVSGSWGTVQIHTAEEYGGKNFMIQTGAGYPFDKTEIWATPVWAFERMALYGDMPQTYDQIYHKTNVFLAGWKSILENNGQAVKLSDVPEGWESPVSLPTAADDPTVALFIKKFGK